MWYEIWDRGTRNILTWHESEDDALAVIAATIAQHGRSAVSTWMLVHEDGTEQGYDAIIAANETIADYALQAAPHKDS